MANERYLVTARKYRPQIFSELVSQNHVSETLRNALRLDRLAHAYLFSGPRGVGKTTAARILAKAINCTTDPAERDRYEPCRQCESCRSFEEGRNLNIIEIDAASNNSVDDVRVLRDKVRIPPQGARRKVYIIDEVHMLSNAAFNALLKTLEEPPPHVLFIFATTEPHKVLPTILSRCQRFDFRRIAVQEIVDRLKVICREESITADDASLILIARRGDGALRDAFSVFDQAVSLCGTTLTYETLAEALGVIDIDLFFEITDHIARSNKAGVLQQIETLISRGNDIHEFISSMAEHFRNLLVARTMQSTDLIEADTATRKRYAKQAEDFSESDLLRLLMIIADAETDVKQSTQPRLKLELALLKMSSLASSVEMAALLKKLDWLEQQVNAGTLPSAAPAQPTRQAPKVDAEPSVIKLVQDQPEPASAQKEPPPVETPPVEKSVKKSVEEAEPEEDIPDEPEPAAQEKPPPAPPRDEPPSSPPTVQPMTLFGTPALKKEGTAKSQVTKSSDSSQDLFSGSSALATVPAPHVDPHFGMSIQKVKQVWPSYVKRISRERIHVGALLQHTIPSHTERNHLIIHVPDAFHQRMLNSEQIYLQDHLFELMSDDDQLPLKFMVSKTVDTKKTALPDAEPDPFERIKRLRQDNEIIRALFDQFGGELVW